VHSNVSEQLPPMVLSFFRASRCFNEMKPARICAAAFIRLCSGQTLTYCNLFNKSANRPADKPLFERSYSKVNARRTKNPATVGKFVWVSDDISIHAS
jgi:hypothetical protein